MTCSATSSPATTTDSAESDGATRAGFVERSPAHPRLRVGDNTAFRNARQHSGRPNARIEPGRVPASIGTEGMNDEADLLKLYQDNPDSQGWLGGVVFRLVCWGRIP